MEQFGYMNKSDISLKGGFFMDESVIELAIREFQDFANLDQTGKLPRIAQRLRNLIKKIFVNL